MLKLFRSVLVFSFLSIVSSLSSASEVVDINSADAEMLAQSLTGIGPSKAEAIVAYRAENGKFASVDDLVNVQGIGLKTLENIREYLIAGSNSTTTSITTPELPSLDEAAIGN